MRKHNVVMQVSVDHNLLVVPTELRTHILVDGNVELYLTLELTKQLHKQLGEVIDFIEFTKLGLKPPAS